MSKNEQIAAELESLEAIYPFRVVRSAEQYQLWLSAYIEDLKPYTVEAVHKACQIWRRGEAKKFPLIGELLKVVRQAAEPAKREACNQLWRPATETEYAAMTMREKLREQKLLAMEAYGKRGPMWCSNGHLAPDNLPEAWHRWTAIGNDHSKEARRLQTAIAEFRESYDAG